MPDRFYNPMLAGGAQTTVARVLIIGATSAVASATACLMAARGDTLFLLARNPKRLSQLASTLGAAVVGSEAGDFTQLDANPARVARGIEALGGLDLALIAHGDLGDQRRSESHVGEALSQFETNFTSVVSFLIPLANLIEDAGHGAIAVLSSVAAERGRPRNYTYAAAKSAANTYLQGLRSRLWKAGGRIHILKLGPVDTPMTADHDKNATFTTAESAARGILRAIERGRSEAYVPAHWALIMALVRWLPERIFQRIPSLSDR